MINIFKRILAIILCIVLAAGIYTAYKSYSAKEAANAYELRQISAQIPPLEEKINELNARRVEIEAEYSAQMVNRASEQFVFTECPSELYNEVYPIFEEAGLSGVIVLSKTELFNQFGKINFVQFKEMINSDWAVCIGWDGTSDLEASIKEMLHTFEVFKVDAPDSIYFPEGTYDPEYNEILEQYGLNIILHHGENGMPLHAAGADEGFWYVGLTPWSYNSVIGDIDTIANEGGNYAFSISFSGFTDKFNAANFKSAIKQMKPYLEDGSITICDLDAAYIIQRNTTILIEESIPRMEAELAAIDRELEETRAALEAIYEKWNNR